VDQYELLRYVPSKGYETDAQGRLFEFVPSALKLRTWLPDEIYSIIQQHPTSINSNLPGLSQYLGLDTTGLPQYTKLDLPPSGAASQLGVNSSLDEDFFEEERENHPRALIYRFYACGGFWLLSNENIARFLQSFENHELIDSVPFIRQVLKVLIDLLNF
jgi:hypothetical protein